MNFNFPFFQILSISILFNITFGNQNHTIESTENIENIEINEQFPSELKRSNASVKKLDKFFKMESTIFENYLKDEDLRIIPGWRADDDFDNWDPPEELKRDLPFYLAGFDFNNRPFWIIEYGKYDYSKYANGGRKMEDLFQKCFRYFTYTAIKSRAIKSTPQHRVNQHGLLIDFEGLAVQNVINPRALRLQLQLIHINRRFVEKGLHKIICINLNDISETLFRVGKSAIIPLSKVMEVYGTDKSKWVPVLLKNYPKDQLPEWYGGEKGFKPLYVIG